MKKEKEEHDHVRLALPAKGEATDRSPGLEQWYVPKERGGIKPKPGHRRSWLTWLKDGTQTARIP